MQFNISCNGSKMCYNACIMNEQSQMVTLPSSGTRVWRLHGEVHREDGPAVEFTDGSKVWFLHGRQHRDAAPAIEYADGTVVWFQCGKRHREDGAAVEYANGTVQWWLNDVQYDAIESWAAAVLQHRMQSCTVETVDAFVHPILKKQVDECI